MPIYPFECECGAEVEAIRDVDDRDKPLLCVKCGRVMKRVFSSANFGKPAFQMQAILGSGEKVSGNFGVRPKLEPKMRTVRKER